MDQAAYELPTQPRRKRRLMIAILLGSAIAMLGAATMSLAVFTDQNSNSGSWSTGTIVLGLNPASTVFTESGIMPGASGSQTVTVSNTGTGDLRYAMSTSATNPDSKGLRSKLTLSIDEGACPSSGTNVYSGTLAGAAFGSAAQGVDTGDRDLAAGTSEDLCFSWSFPLGSGNGYQNASTTATFTFDAEQTKNN
jgi:spore coat-associated protein N